MFIDLCMGMWIDRCIDMHISNRSGVMYVDMCVDLCMDMCVDMHIYRYDDYRND